MPTKCSKMIIIVKKDATLFTKIGLPDMYIYVYTLFDHHRVDIFDQIEYGVCGIFYFPWHRHQIEMTNGF